MITDDEIRSLAISQRLLGTRRSSSSTTPTAECSPSPTTEFKKSIQDETGIKPGWSAEALPDLNENVLQSIARIKASPFVPNKESVRGFVFDVATGRLREAQDPDQSSSELNTSS